MIPVLRRFPARIRSMAIGAVGRKTQCCMVGVRCTVVIGLMAGCTNRGGGGVIRALVATAAIADLVSKGEREEGVRKTGAAPGIRINTMTLGAIG